MTRQLVELLDVGRLRREDQVFPWADQPPIITRIIMTPKHFILQSSPTLHIDVGTFLEYSICGGCHIFVGQHSKVGHQCHTFILGQKRP